MKKNRSQKKSFVVMLCLFLTMVLGIGYAVLSQQLLINGGLEYGTMKWDVGFETATDGGGTINSNPVIASDKKSITITCDIGTSTASETCIATAVIANNSTFDVQLEANPTITYDSVYVKSVEAIWSEDSKNIAALDTIDAESTKEIKISIVTNELSSDMLPSTSLTVPITITMNWIEYEDDTLKILSVGNSFSVDSLEYVYQIANNLGYKDVILGNLYIGGCSLATHLSNAQNDSASYTYYTNSTGEWKTTNSYKISTAVKSENWDYITFQQASPNSGQEDTYDDLNELTELIKPMSSNAKFAWHMTWAYQSDSSHSGFANYNNDQMTMYNAIVTAVQNKIATSDNIEIILPVGTAIQNARTSYLGDTLTRDGYHLSYNEGRYIAGVAFLHALTGISVDDLTYKPSDVSDIVRQIAIEVANSSYIRPYRITQSQFTTLPPIGYTQLDLKIQEEAYYDSASYNGNKPQELVIGYDNNPQFMSSGKIYTKNDLPNGTIIEVADGFRYRPEGWINGIGVSTTSERPANVTTSSVTVDDEWWGEYTERAFNISLISGEKINDSNRADFYKALKVYIPSGEYSGYKRVELQLTKSAYYCTLVNYPIPPELTTASNYSVADANDQFFWATQSFTKETLPVGSIIRIAEGWQYRAEGWDSSNFQHQTASERSPNVTTTSVVVDEAWWGEYTERGFNIAKEGNATDISGYTEEQINDVFQIYVPKE